MRSCDGCTLCCKVYQIIEMDSLADEYCYECEVGKGCKIYADRPVECSEYKCAWLQNEDWSDELRPDRCHVVMEIPDDDYQVLRVIVDPDHRNVILENDAVLRKINDLRSEGRRAYVRIGNTRIRLEPLGTQGGLYA